MPFQLDPEVAAEMAALLGGRPPPEPVPVGDIQARRTFIDTIQTLHASLIPRADHVTQTDYYTTASDGHKILLRWYAKKDTAPNSSAIFYMHGGGMIASAVSNYNKVLSQYVSLTSVPFLSVEYRLAPEHPYPTPLEDCYAGLTWLHANAHALSIDTARIAIMGDSAGGGLAACLAYLARERKGPPIAKQILIYPMLDDRTADPDAAILPFATWNYLDNETGWTALLGARRGGNDVPVTAAAARLEDARGLPELYLDVGELDIFRDEDIMYALNLVSAGVSTELHVYPGVPHAWEVFSPKAGVSRRAMADRVRAIMGIKSVGGEKASS